MFEKLKFWAKPAPAPAPPPPRDVRESAFSTSPFVPIGARMPSEITLKSAEDFTQPISITADGVGYSFDEALEEYGLDSTTLKQAFSVNRGAVPDALFGWYSQQSFIGYQACAIISQHWLVNKALSIPAKDAIRNGYEITTDDGEELEVKFISDLKKADKKYKINKNLIEFEINRRRFGFRIAIFVVESDDEDYYRKPFNIDGVAPGSYKGITQVDPSWIAPILDGAAAANPASLDFYEPTWWLISGQLYHKSHLVIARYIEPPDILKPSYQYGGIPLTQLILERTYAAERTANEAPMLTQTKRLNIIKANIASITANPAGFEEKLQQFSEFRDNYGVYVIDLEDEVQQIETSLTDLDAVIMTQYQLVAAVSEIPATKLMGTSPKGFNATGEHEQESYFNLLENIQTDIEPILDRHHELVIKSDLAPDSPFEVVVVWNPVNSPSAKDLAEINFNKAQTDSVLVLTGAIDAEDVRKRLINDARSGYTGIESFEEGGGGENDDDDDDDDDDDGNDLDELPRAT